MKKLKILIALCCLGCGSLEMMAQTVSALRINEVMSANVDQFIDPSWNYGGWIEVYNPTVRDMNLQGLWVSDDPNNLKMCHVSQSTPIEAGGYANLWFDHHYIKAVSQMNMKLDCDGGTIYLSTNNGRLIDQVDYPPAIPRTSWARTEDGDGEWEYASNPTPEATNETIIFAKNRLEAPVISHDSQVFTTTLRITVEIPEGCTLRYTMNGSTPTMENGNTSTNGSILVAATHVLRFALFREGYMSSPVVTRTYIRKNMNFSLPIMSIVTNPDHLYSNQLGIFVVGTNGRAGKGTSQKCNWNMDWDRPVNFEYFAPTGECLVNQEAEISRCGGHSKGFTPMSFKVHASKVFEHQNYLPYQFFSLKPYLKHKALQIRGGANDYNCRIIDASLQQIVLTSGIDVDLQAYQPICHYINGKFMGTINLREPNNKHNVFANHGLDDDEIDMFEIECDSCYRQMCGTDEAWKNLLSLSSSATDPLIYEQIKTTLLDVDEFCNYMAIQLYLGNNDWPQNNQKAWRPIAENGKFRFVLYDLDAAFTNSSPFTVFQSRQWFTFCRLYDVPGVTNYTREVEVVPLFLNLIKNEDFRRQFIDAFCLVGGSVYEPTRAVELVRKLVNVVEPMQLKESGYSGRNVSPWGSANSVISNLEGRQAVAYSALKNYSAFGLSNTTPQDIQISANVDQARIMVNNQVVPLNQFNGKLFPPVTLKAQAPSGYRFLGWKAEGVGSLGSEEVVFKAGTNWMYYDQGSLPNSNWRLRVYSTSDWNTGTAPLGYSNIFSVNTTLDYGGDASNKRPTYYFRKTFMIDDDINENDVFHLNYTLDDGCIIYVNGQEVGRVNMNTGTATYETYASISASTLPLSGSMEIPASRFVEGTNVIAVEVHNISASSSDICWDASLTRVVTTDASEEENYYSDQEELQMPVSYGKITLKACFERVANEADETDVRGVLINEVSAGNSVNVNEYFKKNDWIELYNQTDHEIDLSGMYLSDDLWDATKYQISAEGTEASTIIPANGYKIIWCDGLDTKSELHAPFKLKNEDGQLVVLTSEDLSWQDTLIYCVHDGNQSFGRYPDGGERKYVMTTPTILKQNIMNSYSTEWIVPEEFNGIQETLVAHSGGLGINCSEGVLNLKSEEEPDVVLSIYTLGGALAMQRKMSLPTGHAQVSILMLAPGTYVARMKDSQGNECSTKFMKK